MMKLGLSAVFRTVEEALATGQAGIPVSARMQWSVGTADEAPTVAAGLLSRLSALLCSSPSRVMVQQHRSGKVLNILATLAGGQTISLSLLCRAEHETAAADDACQAADLLIVGNHGVIRLEGDSADFATAAALEQDFAAAPGRRADAQLPADLEAAVRQSLQSQSAVSPG